MLHCDAILKASWKKKKNQYKNVVSLCINHPSITRCTPLYLVILLFFLSECFQQKKRKGEGRNTFLISLYLILPPDLILPNESPEQVLNTESIPMTFGKQLQQIKVWAGKRRVTLILYCIKIILFSGFMFLTIKLESCTTRIWQNPTNLQDLVQLQILKYNKMPFFCNSKVKDWQCKSGIKIHGNVQLCCSY